MRLLVCGSRDWTDKSAISVILGTIKATGPLDTIIQGGNGYYMLGDKQHACRTESELEWAYRGADALAYQAAKALGLKCETYFANWKLGAKAGPMRNTRMLVEGKPDMTLAFSIDLAGAKGTKHMVQESLRARVETFLYDGAALGELGKHNAERYGLKL